MEHDGDRRGTVIKLFSRYATIGVLNTALHWMAFGVLVAAGLSQGPANLLAFLGAVTFSFFANARFTFRENASGPRYLLFVAFMGAMAFGAGLFSDRFGLHPIATLIGFSAFSLIAGFLFSRFVVFGTRP